MIKHVNLVFFLDTKEHASPFCFAYVVATMYNILV